MSTPKPNLAIRLPSEAKEEFDSYCAANGCTQPEAVQKLLNLQKLEEAAKKHPEAAAILSDFRHHAAALVALLEASLVLSDGAAARARDEFAGQLEQNAQLIRAQQNALAAKEASLTELRTQLTSIQNDCSSATQKATELSERCEYARRQIEEMTQKMAVMAEEAAETKSMSKSYQRLLEEINELRRDNKSLSDQLKDAQIAHANEIRKLEDAKHQAQLEAERLKRGGE